jgi:hypothetical protein
MEASDVFGADVLVIYLAGCLFFTTCPAIAAHWVGVPQ